jgi:hypothetical protein
MQIERRGAGIGQRQLEQQRPPRPQRRAVAFAIDPDVIAGLVVDRGLKRFARRGRALRR